MQDTKIRELSFITEVNTFPQDSFLTCLLERCPVLEKLSLAGKFSVQTMRDITYILKQGVVLPLKSLYLENISDGFADAEDLGALIQSIGNTSNNTSAPSSNNDGGLETLTLGNRALFGRPALSALARCHSKTLTTLVWPQFTSLNLSFFADIVQALPRLQTLKARVWLNLRIKDGPDMDIVFQKQWNCLELTELDIDLGLSCKFDSIQDRYWKGSLSDRCLTYVFSQMARLVNLKRLRIRSEVELLTLGDEGYLRNLSNLKQLQVLHFDRWSENDMGSKEATWMIENWPSLGRVSGHWRLWSPSSKNSDGTPSDEFTRSLTCQRTWIRIKNEIISQGRERFIHYPAVLEGLSFA
ncbi:hypothetical protein BGZ76_008733 [Entomortierella beljakovae]|nr:hypothetical protein BGZ76_008733 [Entomortierella beljakovae]